MKTRRDIVVTKIRNSIVERRRKKYKVISLLGDQSQTTKPHPLLIYHLRREAFISLGYGNEIDLVLI